MTQPPAAPPGFSSRDPLAPAFWDERFDRGYTPWDRGGVPERLRRYVAEWPAAAAATASPPAAPSAAPSAAPHAAPAAGPVALIPGCGAAYELAFLSEAGWNATAIDFAPVAVAAARQTVGARWQGRVVQADFFDFQPAAPLDLIYERAFLCALPRALWPQVAARWAALLPSGAVLAGYFFFDDNAKGPPFGIARTQLDALLSPCFRCEEDQAVLDSAPVFEGKERWMVWRRL